VTLQPGGLKRGACILLPDYTSKGGGLVTPKKKKMTKEHLQGCVKRQNVVSFSGKNALDREVKTPCCERKRGKGENNPLKKTPPQLEKERGEKDQTPH